MSPVDLKKIFLIIFYIYIYIYIYIYTHIQSHIHTHTLFAVWDNFEEDHSWLLDYYSVYSIHYPIYKIVFKILTVPAVFFNYNFALKFVIFVSSYV